MQWLGKACKFEIVQEHLQIEGYQMYAVEKWCELCFTCPIAASSDA